MFKLNEVLECYLDCKKNSENSMSIKKQVIFICMAGQLITWIAL